MPYATRAERKLLRSLKHWTQNTPPYGLEPMRFLTHTIQALSERFSMMWATWDSFKGTLPAWYQYQSDKLVLQPERSGVFQRFSTKTKQSERFLAALIDPAPQHTLHTAFSLSMEIYHPIHGRLRALTNQTRSTSTWYNVKTKQPEFNRENLALPSETVLRKFQTGTVWFPGKPGNQKQYLMHY